MFEEISSVLYNYFPYMIFGVIFLVFVLALNNRKRLATKEHMSFELYKQDWQRAHMYQKQVDQEKRTTFNKWLKSNFLLGKCLAIIGFTPNLTSVLAFVLSTASAYYFIRAVYVIKIASPISMDYFLSDLHFALAVAFLLLSGLIDVLDGAIARLTYSSTHFGDLLDNVLDKYSDAIVLIAIIYGCYGGLADPFIGLFPFIGFAALLGSLLVDYARARTIGLGLKEMTVTIGERPFRILLISMAAAFQFVAQLSAALNIRVPIGGNTYLHELFLNSLQWGILILAILTHISAIQIVIYAQKNLPKK